MVKIREALPLLDNGAVDINKWLGRISEHRSSKEVELISNACELANAIEPHILTSLHKPCIQQGLIMAEILHGLGLDTPTLSAAIVYHAYQYARLPLDRIKNILGEDIARLVLGVQKIDHVPTEPNTVESSIRQMENLRRMLLAIVEDIRVVLIKLASHTCEMRAAVSMDEAFKRKLAKDTEEIYAPLANRLGIGQIKWELEDYAFRFLAPEEYKQIAHLLDERRIDRENYIDNVVKEILEALQLQGIEASVFGRAKHIYSIWKKMQRKGVKYDQIYDVRAIRILASNIRDCYAALGVVHGLWQHIPKEFDDYIANPKSNGYQSLHTAVIGPEGKTLEVQIRTPLMHEQAELGVAAHWRYKENLNHDAHYEAKLADLRQALKWQEEWEADTEINEALNAEIFQDRVYVLTPKGEVIDLPQGATVLDFAYHIHTEIGNRCRGAKINGRMVPLIYALKSGERVEILTAKSGGPSRDWLNRYLGFLKTGRARAKVLQWFKRQDKAQNVQEGREVLDRELRRLGIENLSLETLANQLKISKVEDMLAALGNGEIKVAQILSAIQALAQPLQKPLPIIQGTKSFVHQEKIRSTDIMVSGVGNLLCHMARCCRPVPGDEIIGYITLGRGVSVHRKDCINVLQARQNKLNRLIQVEWGAQIYNRYSVDIVIRAYDREGLLHDISAVLSSEHVDIMDVRAVSNKQENIADLKFVIEISGLESLSKILNSIQRLPNIIEVKRVTNG